MKKKIAAALCAVVMAFGGGSALPVGDIADIYAGAEGISEQLGTLDMTDYNSGKAVALPSTLIKYARTLDECRQVYNEDQNGIYFLNKDKLSFLSLKDGSYGSVCTFSYDADEADSYFTSVNPLPENFKSRSYTSEMKDSYECGGKLYTLMKLTRTERYTNVNGSKKFYAYILQVFDLDTGTLDSASFLTDGNNRAYSAVGADDTGRIYLAYQNSTDKKYYMTLNDSSLSLLDTAEIPGYVYSFGAVDTETGAFCYEGDYVWNGKNFIILNTGKISGDILSVNAAPSAEIGEAYTNTLHRHISLEKGGYFCVDTPASKSLAVFSSAAIGGGSSDTLLTAERSYTDRDGNGNIITAAVGSRTVSDFGSGSGIVTVEGNCTVSELDTATGERIASQDTEYAVFSLMKNSSDVIAVEKQGDGYYLQKLSWKKAENLKMNKETADIEAGGTYQLTAQGDGSFEEKISWSSDDLTVASVNSHGVVYGTHPGTATITAKSASGLTAICKVTVTESKTSAASGYIADSDGKGASSSNISRNNYTYWANNITSYMYLNAGGEYVRVEHIGSETVIEGYSADGLRLLSSKAIADELPLFGGAFMGEEYNFIVYGSENAAESNDAEVIRVVKYTKDWERVSEASISNVNTYLPFDAGSLRMTELNGTLYVYTCHEMYLEAGETLNHQANMILVIDEEEMTLTECEYNPSSIMKGYISHSLNQFILTDGERIYRADHGDANPRAITIVSSAVGDKIIKVNQSYTTAPLEIAGEKGLNYTGASIGGFELSTDNCILAGNTVDQTAEFNTTKQRNIFISVSSKDLAVTNTKFLTDYAEDSGITVNTPHLVKLADDSFMVMWEEMAKDGTYSVKVCTIDGNGELTSEISTLDEVRLSDCKPELYPDGLVRWYTTDNDTPCFYAINPFDPEKIEASDEDFIPGDVNRDGLVNIVDIALVKQYILGWDVDINLLAADVNKDGSINPVDIAIIKKIILGWDVDV